MLGDLTQKQQRFVDEYLVDMNATQAAIRAGYSQKTAYSIGAENLGKPLIRTAIAARQRETARNLTLSREDVVAGLHREATLGGAGSSHSARVSAWVQLGKHLGMFGDEIDITYHPEMRALRRKLSQFLEATDAALKKLCPPEVAGNIRRRVLESVLRSSDEPSHVPQIMAAGSSAEGDESAEDRYSSAVGTIHEVETAGARGGNSDPDGEEEPSVDVSVGVSVEVRSTGLGGSAFRKPSLYDVPEAAARWRRHPDCHTRNKPEKT